jgi:hypothetical protein
LKLWFGSRIAPVLAGFDPHRLSIVQIDSFVKQHTINILSGYPPFSRPVFLGEGWGEPVVLLQALETRLGLLPSIQKTEFKQFGDH